MEKIIIKSLLQALIFVKEHGDAVKELDYHHDMAMGAYSMAGGAVELTDGSILLINAYSNGPLSEVTPDEDFGIEIFGYIKEQ